MIMVLDYLQTDTLNTTIYDSESNLQSVVTSRETILIFHFVSRNSDGIFLNNNDDNNGGFYIDLTGLDSTQLGGNVSFEMVLKNVDLGRKSLYF